MILDGDILEEYTVFHEKQISIELRLKESYRRKKKSHRALNRVRLWALDCSMSM